MLIECYFGDMLKELLQLNTSFKQLFTACLECSRRTASLIYAIQAIPDCLERTIEIIPDNGGANNDQDVRELMAGRKSSPTQCDTARLPCRRHTGRFDSTLMWLPSQLSD